MTLGSVLEILADTDEFAAQAHSTQMRKYTGEPYIVHPREVMRIVQTVPHTLVMLQAALLHDVLEDTDCTFNDLDKRFGLNVASMVYALTDQFVDITKYGNRAARKRLERGRLGMCSSEVQTVKLADFLSNTRTIVEHDPGFARVYMQEKLEALPFLANGNHVLWMKASEQASKFFNKE